VRANAAAIAVLTCPPDTLRATILDDAGLGQRLDEGVLPFDGPAVVAGADGHGSEWLFRFFHMVLLEPYWNIDEGV
jgi:hypothetical protein